MAFGLRTYDEPIVHSSGRYQARVVGRMAEDGMWEGWMEFEPLDTPGTVVVSSVETRQPAREHLEYWAQGLTVVYGEGAVDRALHPVTVRARRETVPLSDRPASRVVRIPEPVIPEPVLDPFDIGGRNLEILRKELGALDRPRLLNIIAAYDLNPGRENISALSDHQLVTFIVVAVETRLTPLPRG